MYKSFLFIYWDVNYFFFWNKESPKFLLSMNQSEKTLDVLRRMYAVNTGESKDVNSPNSNNVFVL